MNTSTRLKSHFAGILAAASVLGLAALLPITARAQQVLVTATDPLPTQQNTNTGFYFDAAGQTYANTSFDLGLFTFNPTQVDTLDSLVGVQIAIELNDLGTKLGTFGYNEVDLTLDGIDTGIALNGYGTGNSGGNSLSPGAVTGIASALNAGTILSLFQGGGYTYSVPLDSSGKAVDSGTNEADPAVAFDAPITTNGTTGAGQLVVGVTMLGGSSLAAQNYASDGSPQQVFLEGGTASMSIANYIIPFEPSQALGFGLIALFIALWFIPQTKDMMKRMLVPNRA